MEALQIDEEQIKVAYGDAKPDISQFELATKTGLEVVLYM